MLPGRLTGFIASWTPGLGVQPVAQPEALSNERLWSMPTALLNYRIQPEVSLSENTACDSAGLEEIAEST